MRIRFTSLRPLDYLSQTQTYHYLTNIVGLINYQLPGVFKHNPIDPVNISLWTIPFELECYAIMSALIFTVSLKRPWIVAAATVGFLVVSVVLLYAGLGNPDAGIVGKVVDKFFTGKGSRLFSSFLLGIVSYLYRDKIPYDHRLAAALTVFCVVVACLGPNQFFSFPILNLVIGPVLAYLTAYLGVSKLPTLPLFHRGDYSYGIYLYGFPMQQSAMALFPSVKSYLFQLLIALPAITLFSIFSWHMIEKPILGLRKKFSFVARVRDLGTEGSPAHGVAISTPPATETAPAKT